MTTYYVDPAVGDDSYDGLSKTDEGGGVGPWETLPGSRNAGDSGDLNTNSISAGDTIEIKAGSAFTSANGGRVLIDTDHYATGTSGSHVTIMTSTDWGTGDVDFDGSGITIPQWSGLMRIDDSLDYYDILGNADSRIVIHDFDSQDGYGVSSSGDDGNPNLNHQYEYITCYDSVDGIAGFNFAWSNDLAALELLAYNIPKDQAGAGIGINIGGVDDQVTTDCTFTDCEAYLCGTGAGANDLAHGWAWSGTDNLKLIRCTAHDNERDGFDCGNNDDSTSQTSTLIDCESWDNGEDGFAVTGGGGATSEGTYINCISWGNSESGFSAYNGADADLYHCIAHNNGESNGPRGNIVTFVGSGDVNNIQLTNCILYKPAGSGHQIWRWTGDAGAGTDINIDLDNCMLIPRSADSEDCVVSDSGTLDYTDTLTDAVEINSVTNCLVGIAYDPDFDVVSSTTYETNDYHLGNASDAEDAGTYLSSPTEVLLDKDSETRLNPPEIGAYEILGGVVDGPRSIATTQMYDAWDMDSDRQRLAFDHPEIYSYIDISQNSHKQNQDNWTGAQYARTYIDDDPRPINSTKIYGADGVRYSDAHGVECFWRAIIGGGASARFHRPPDGQGINTNAQNSIKAARLLETKVTFWEMVPDTSHSLLSNRESDEAYLSYEAGLQYALYFTNGGTVSLDLDAYGGDTFDLDWVDIDDGTWGSSTTVAGGGTRSISAPSSGPWVAAIVKQ